MRSDRTILSSLLPAALLDQACWGPRDELLGALHIPAGACWERLAEQTHHSALCVSMDARSGGILVERMPFVPTGADE